MAIIYYIARCQWCGKTGTRTSGTSTGGAPRSQPNVSGKCQSSPNGFHAPRMDQDWYGNIIKNRLPLQMRQPVSLLLSIIISLIIIKCFEIIS